jgi:predicted aspartyl protease
VPGPFQYLLINPQNAHPSPVCEVEVRFGKKSISVLAQLDTGADGTTMPQRVIDHLRPQKIREIEVEGAIGSKEIRPMYVVDIDFQGTIYRNHPVTLLPKRSYMLIGRDLLRNHFVQLDGPNEQFTIDP